MRLSTASSFWGGRLSPGALRSILCCVQGHAIEFQDPTWKWQTSLSPTWRGLSHLRLGKHGDVSCIPRKKRKWDLANSIVSATDSFWSNYFPHLFFCYSFLTWLAFPHYTTGSELYYNLGLTQPPDPLPPPLPVSLQGEWRTKRTIQVYGGLPWSSRLFWRSPEKPPQLSLTWPSQRQRPPTRIPHPGASVSSPALFKLSTHTTLCMKYEWAEFFIILGYLITQIVTETEGEEMHCSKRKKLIQRLVRTDWNAEEKMTE